MNVTGEELIGSIILIFFPFFYTRLQYKYTCWCVLFALLRSIFNYLVI